MSANPSVDRMIDPKAAALAAEIFDHFSSASTMRQILALHRSMCDTIGLRPGPINEFYPKLKSRVKSWKAQALWKKFDARAAHRVYNKGTVSNGMRVLVIGAGPCGLRAAIEAQLLGAKVVVVEKRDRFSRNNVLHLWPFLITDLRNLGAKKFYGKFCAGAIDHISIRQLQCILLKVALLLGVEVHEAVSFNHTIEPKDGCGWRANISPHDHAVSHYEFDVLLGADGKRNTLEGFRRKEFRGRLAIAITANFINKKTWAEAKVEEISGVAFIFNQAFFKELYEKTGIDLENIVYYKDETHYFVMTAKKHSLIDKGVIIQDFADPAELLAPANVNKERLLDYAKEAADFSTKYQMPDLEFAVNHYGKPDVAMFDFTSMFAAEISCRVTVRKNYRLLQCLVGDSLLEPFWPTGSGCARGFLSSMDAAYAIKLFSNQRNSILAVLAQRESIYRLLAQTTPENLHRDIGSYTLEPATRYPNLNKTTVAPHQVKHLLDSDDPALLEQIFVDTQTLHSAPEPIGRRKRRTGDTIPLSAVLLRWIKAQLSSTEFVGSISETSECFTNGKVLCCLINRYRPDLVDLSNLKDKSIQECNEIAFVIIERELGIPKVMSASESVTLENIESKVWLNYLEQICEVFRGEIPHVKHPKLDLEKLRESNRNVAAPDFSKLLKYSSGNAAVRKSKSPELEKERPRRSHKLDLAAVKESLTGSRTPDGQPRRSRKRRSYDKVGNVDDRVQRLKEIEANRNERHNKRRLQRSQQTENFYKSLALLQAGNLLREIEPSGPFEDYSIFMYRQDAPQFGDRVKNLEKKLLHPDRERGIQSAMPRNCPDDKFNDRIKSIEQQFTSKGSAVTEKKPKDLLRAIGKIESNDWNIREIEKKIEQSKKTEVGKSREKVPKWSKEQFVQLQSKMANADEREDTPDERFKEIDETIKNLDKQLKGGNMLETGERGKNKVASMVGNFGKKDNESSEDKAPISKSGSKANLVFSTQNSSDSCHFCKQKVYLMEKLAAESLVMHRSCLKCHHCHTSLRVGGYAFDRNDPEGRFYCTQHFRLPAKAIRPVTKRTYPRYAEEGDNVEKKVSEQAVEKHRGRPETVAQMDKFARGETPERIEFENTDAMSDGEPSLEHIIDENEWTDRNFGTGTEESDFSSSEESDSDSDSEMYEEAIGSPLGAQTFQLATDWIGRQRYNSNQYSDDDEFYASSGDDEADSQTEGEELERAREIRMQEVKLKPLPYLPTDTETEVVSAAQSNQANGSSSKNDMPIDKNEIKFIENKSDKKISSEIDALNETLYKLNNFLKLSKDVDDLKRGSMVKNDIQKKLDLKSQWLNSNNGSTASLNSLPADDFKKGSFSSVDTNTDRADENKDSGMGSESRHSRSRRLSNSAQNLFGRNLTPDPSNDRRSKLKQMKASSIHNINDELNPKKGKSKRRHRSTCHSVDDSLNGSTNNLAFSDQSLPQIDNEVDLDKERGKKKMRELKNRIDMRKSLEAQVVVPKVTRDPSQRDLSKFFPKIEEKSSTPPPCSTPAAKDKKQQHAKLEKCELKPADLSRYFIPAPVQQTKSIPSPSQSPILARKVDPKQNILVQSLPNTHQPKFLKVENQPKPQQAVELRRTGKRNLESLKVNLKPDRLSAEIDEISLNGERSPSGDYTHLFANLKTPADNIDDLFNEVAANYIPPTPTVVPPTPLATDKENKEPPKFKLPKKDDREQQILSKLSTNLQNEIKLLEKQLSLDLAQSNEIDANETEKIEEKKSSEQTDKNESASYVLSSQPEVKTKPPRSRRNSAQMSKTPSIESPKSASFDEEPKRKKSVTELAEQFDEILSSKPRTCPSQESTKNNVEEEILLAKGIIDENGNEVPRNRSRKNSVVELTQKFDEATIQPIESVELPPPKSERKEWKTNAVYEQKQNEPKNVGIPSVTVVLKKDKKVSPDKNTVSVDLKKDQKTSPPKRQETKNESKVDLKKKREHLKSKKSPEKQTSTKTESIQKDLNQQESIPKATPIKPIRRKLSLTKEPPNTPESPKIESTTPLADEPKIEHKPPVRPNDFRGFEIPPEELRQRHDHLSKSVSPPIEDDIPSLRRISDIMNGKDTNQAKSKKSDSVERNPNFVSIRPGVYDNIPSTQTSVEPSTSIEEPSRNSVYFDCTDRDYDNIPPAEPIRPQRTKNGQVKARDPTDQLLERSRMIHNRKQEFMNERYGENNPYIKRMIERESRESPRRHEPMLHKSISIDEEYDYRSARDTRSIDFDGFHVNNSRLQKSVSIEEEYEHRSIRDSRKKSGSLRSLNACVASTSGSIFGVFKRSPPKSRGRDNCVIC